MKVSRIWAMAALLLVLQGCGGMLAWEENGRSRAVYGADWEAQPSRPLKEGEHFVRRGDTVYAIAFRNSLDFRELARWNGIGADYLIYPGQILRLTPPPRAAPPRHRTDDIESQGMPMDHEVAKPQPVTPGTPAPETSGVTALPGEIVEPSGFEWTWPTNGIVTRGYAPTEGRKGLDFVGNIGQPVFAAAPGYVVYSGNALKGYGELIIIKHDDVHLSAYGYNRKRYVKEGDIVTAGQPIGEMGHGPENKPLLHFEVRKRGKPTDPAALLPAKIVKASS